MFSFAVFLTNMGLIFVGVYRESAGLAGLNYIGFGLGLSISAQLNARFMDTIYKYFKRKNGNIGRPEFRLRMMSVRLPPHPTDIGPFDF